MNQQQPTHDDQTLIQATLAGDREAFGGLVLRYQDRLFNSLILVLGCEADAQDVTQDAFVQAFRRLDSFRGQSSFYTWLFRVGRNLAISRLRSRRKTASLSGHDGSNLDLPGTEPGPDAPLEVAESIQQLQAALARLSEEHRSIVVLRELEGMDYDAIATALDIPVGTVRSRLHRARSQLKMELEAIGVSPEH